MEALLQQRINEYKQQSLYRQRQVLSSCSKLMVFCHNDYLGMAKHPAVITAFKQAADSYGVGGTSSQLVAGYRDIHREVERAFAEFLQRDDALLFSSGYLANLGVISALAQKNDVLIMDRQAHASLVDATKLSAAKFKRFLHQDYQQLEQILCDTYSSPADAARQVLLLTDGVFSVGGDIADLPRCVALSQQYPATLLVDDAHGIGVLGKQGRGVIEHFRLSQHDVPVLVCPLAKAFGTMGAIVAGSKVLIDYLLQFARSYMYTNAIPPALAAATLTSLRLVNQETWRREKLLSLIDYFKKRAAELALPLVESDTPIQIIRVGNPHVAQQMSRVLLKQGIMLTAMRPPSVPLNFSCLRVSLSCLHQEKQLDILLTKIKKAYDDLS